MRKPVVKASIAESPKALIHQQKKKLVDQFADTPESFTINVKPDMKKGKPLIISVKSSSWLMWPLQLIS